MKKRIKIQGFLIFLAVVTVAVFYKHLIPLKPYGTSRLVVDIFGIALFLSGYFLRIAARGYKAKLNPDGKALVTKGPYALTRNPMYLGTLLIGLGIILLILRWYAAFIFLVVYLSIYIPQIKKEEKNLNGLFAKSFSEYCANTPRFFPKPLSFLKKEAKIEIETSWIKKEFSSFAWSAIFVIIVKFLELR